MAARSHKRSRLCLPILALVAFLFGVLSACQGTPSPPTVAPTVTRPPTPTPSPKSVLDQALFTITFNERLIAIETIRVDTSGEQPVVVSEIQRVLDYPIAERRSITLDGTFGPQHYELELDRLGVRSLWIADRDGDNLRCLNNNQAWLGPVLVEPITPAPDILLDSTPSALPFALLALRRSGVRPDEADAPLALHAVDALEDYPVSRPLTVTTAPERQGAVIGTLALEGQTEGGPSPRFTLWIHPGNLTLYSVEIPVYRFSLWEGLAHPALRKPGRLVIQRVSKLPELPVPTPVAGQARRAPLDFQGADGTTRSGTLILPPESAGQGPFPCLLLQGPGSVVPRWDPGDAFAARGWAVYTYDKRGVGQSRGEFNRGPLRDLANDAVAALAMLRQRPELDPQRIVLLGVGEGGLVGALALDVADGFAAGVLGNAAVAGPLLPTLAERQIEAVMAPFYLWEGFTRAAYEEVSLLQWQQWLFEDQVEIGLLGRRISLEALKDLAETDLGQVLSSVQVPVLLLQDTEDPWTPPAGAQTLLEQLRQGGSDNITLQTFQGLGPNLGRESYNGALAPAVEDALFTWLNGVLGR